MSQLTADTLMPLFSALPEDEKHVFAAKIKKMLSPVPKRAKKKDDIYDKIGDIFRPENREVLLAKLVNGDRL